MLHVDATKYLTAREFGERVGLDESKIRHKIRLREIEAVNVSTPTKGAKTRRPVWRIPASELQRFIDKNTQTAA